MAWMLEGKPVQTMTDDALQVYILLFGVGAFETEGIYSMRAVMNNDGLPIDTIIAFESQEDAERWASNLSHPDACLSLAVHLTGTRNPELWGVREQMDVNPCLLLLP